MQSIFGEIRVDTSSAESFLRECAERVEAGEQLDQELVLNEARNLITASIHPSGERDAHRSSQMDSHHSSHHEQQNQRTA